MLQVFIINLSAGNKKGFEIGNVITEYCKSINSDYIIEYVKEKNDTTKIINQYKDFNDVIIYSVGGDGTLNQVVNLVANTNLKLSVIPTGTGNDFYKSLVNFNGDKIDIGKVNDKYFINVASFGIDSEVANTANILKNKKIRGSLVYPISIVKNFCTYKPMKLNINSEEKLITILTICNASFYGGGFNISPNSSLNDGLFDIYTVEKMNKICILKLFYKLIKGTHVNDKKVMMYKTDKINVSSDIDINCNIDGEIIVGKTFDFSIQNSALNIYKDEKIIGLLKSKRIIK